MSLRTLILIPVYNHERGLATMLDGLRASGLPCLLVDDGSEPGCAGAHASARLVFGGAGLVAEVKRETSMGDRTSALD